MAEIINFNEIKTKKKKETQSQSISKKEKQVNLKPLSIIKATLADWDGSTKGNPYRVISIPNDFTLDILAEAIIESFDFDLDHMYGFYDNIKKWSKSTDSYIMDDEYESATGFVTEVTVGEVFKKPKKKMLLLFDYGDEWKFVVELIKGKNAESEMELSALIIESQGDAPPQYPDIEA